MAKFANILETVGHTPVIRINKLAPKGINLFVKNEAFNPLGSVKDRLALGVIEAAEKSGELKPGQTVIEATSGNTGIGLAMVCAAKGYPLVVTMAETFSVERRKLMRFLGAKVVLTPAANRGLAKEMPDTKIVVCEPADAPMLTSGSKQERNSDGSPAAPNAVFKPHPMQGWSPDFIPKLTGDAVDMKVIERLLMIAGPEAMK